MPVPIPARPQTPDWVKDSVFYQIFPDRFARSDRVPKPRNLEPWGAQPTNHGYQGGDLLGVAEHLDHLVDLGVNAIYLNPIFQSASNHRYHTHDYYRVDPLLGGDAALHELVESAHRLGIRIVLDGVFNHASRGFFQFNDILENGPGSPWLDWFFVEGLPLNAYDEEKPANYAGWFNLRELPKLNTANPQVREFIMRVAEYWLREFEIDGWRLDVPNEIQAEGFWQEFRRRVKAVNPEAYLIGEIWQAAPEWLQGDRFDALMNYPFAAATIAFAGGRRVSRALVEGRSYDPYPPIDAAEFGRRIQALLGLYDPEATQAQFNLLDSHDTARLVSLARGDQATLRLATLFQMTYPGAPSIYYGDEIGLRGTDRYDERSRDVDARWAFPWHDPASWDLDLLAYFKAAVALRRAHPILRRGSYKQLLAQDDCYAFARGDARETLVVALNVADEARTIDAPVRAHYPDGAQLRVLFGQGDAAPVAGGQARFRLPARTGVVVTG